MRERRKPRKARQIHRRECIYLVAGLGRTTRRRASYPMDAHPGEGHPRSSSNENCERPSCHRRESGKKKARGGVKPRCGRDSCVEKGADGVGVCFACKQPPVVRFAGFFLRFVFPNTWRYSACIAHCMGSVAGGRRRTLILLIYLLA